MARKKRFGENLTSEQIANMDIKEFNKLSKRDLSKLVSRMAGTANKRAAGLEEKGNTTSSAYRSAQSSMSEKQKERGKLFGLGRGKQTLSDVRKEFARLRNFLRSKVSTSTGYEKEMSRAVEGLKEKGIDLTMREAKDIFGRYDQLKKEFPEIGERAYKYDVVKMISEGSTPRSKEDIDKMIDRLRESYEERERADSAGVSGFFDESEDI